MKPNYSWRLTFLEMAVHRIAYHLSKLVHRIRLRENGMAQGVRFVPTLRRFFNGEDDLGFFHRALIISLRLRLPRQLAAIVQRLQPQESYRRTEFFFDAQ